MFYTLSLLMVVVSLLYSLSTFELVSGLTVLVVLIVYLGAVLILIGYICAVSPNFLSVSLSFSFSLALSCLVLLIFSLGPLFWLCPSQGFSVVSSYFYSFFGGFSLFFILFMMFLVLLMVTTQALAPKSPFRSFCV